jgi:flavin reductase (DIM6/NTAB) family NADH-FMN oxidoreductase RutF
VGHVVDAPLQTTCRGVTSGVATPVSVVAVVDDGLPHSTTVSASASLPMNPPMVLVALDHASELLALIRESGRFGVDVLGSAQSALGLALAGEGGVGKFSGWPGAPGWLACQVADLVDGGDHVVAMGHVLAAETVDGHPLTNHGRLFGTHAAHQEES